MTGFFYSSKPKEFADHNFKFHGKGAKFSKVVGKHFVERGEIALYEQFLLFPPIFQKTPTAYMKKQGIVSEKVKISDLATFDLVLELIFQPATNTTTNDTIKNCLHLKSLHTLTLYSIDIHFDASTPDHC